MTARERRSAAAILFAQAQAFDDEAESEGPELEQDRVHPRRILRREAQRLATTAPKRGSDARRRRGLRMLAGTDELLQAFSVIMARVEELTARIDGAYEAAERDEAERESLLERLEAAGHDTMDWSSEEQHDEGQDDYSSDEEDSDREAAADLTHTTREAQVDRRGDEPTQQEPRQSFRLVARVASRTTGRRRRAQSERPRQKAGSPPAFPDGGLLEAGLRFEDFPPDLLRDFYGRPPVSGEDMILEARGHRMPEDLPDGALVFVDCGPGGDGFAIDACDDDGEYLVMTATGLAIRHVTPEAGAVFLFPPSRADQIYPAQSTERARVRVLGRIVARFTLGGASPAQSALHDERAAIVRSLRRPDATEGPCERWRGRGPRSGANFPKHQA